ncbi:MAG TPA: questin oxidase family protein [Candidatus Binatus sp.]|uniref:questin oxidase family protein n=1 Tax=Candidatus Binatus sp. TaxID=2811406 RepID=UPI002B469EA6|nr:questin oxidase family protein [Candidatus Binatus sp.]HKN12768.1 questin oxidase family protein [Candidatus Binatus sp.]
MNPADYAALDETLEIMAPMGPDLSNGFSNHAPMAIEAMCAMRRADAVMPWFEHYRHSLAPRRARVARLTGDNWRAALGDLRRTEDWFEFFRNELEAHPWQSVLDIWAARLAPGLMAAATHGVIRTGHAVRALALEDTPARRRELADGLAYWAADYLPLPANRHTPVRAKPSEAIARVPMIPLETRRSNFGAFTDALAQLDSFPPFSETLDAVDPNGDTSAFMSDLAGTFARVFLANARNTYTTIAFVHAVTGPSALRPLLPYLREATTHAALAYAWQTAAAMHATFGTTTDLSRFGEITIGNKDDLVDRAIACGDEHAIKFTEVCLREHALDPDPAFLAAAGHAIRMLSATT